MIWPAASSGPAAFATLGAPIVQPVAATPLADAALLWHQPALARSLGLAEGACTSAEGLALLSGAAPWPGCPSRATPYAGHQFGRYTAQLGDGRALLLAELATPGLAPGRQELQLKGAGPTPHARGSDGRAALRSALREALACEALHALGVPSTRALAVVGSSLRVLRDDIAEPAAVLCRVAPSFLRFGHLEYWAHQGDMASLRRLAGWVATQLFGLPPAGTGSEPRRHAAWLIEVARRSAHLVAQWQTLGFAHGVLNTDNCALLGFTLDYGPFGFVERYRPHHIPNASDTEGRYRLEAQPAVMRWNLERLLTACRGLLGESDEAAGHTAAALAAYDDTYARVVMARWAAKLGLAEARSDDSRLVLRWLALLQQARADFTASFRALGELPPARLRDRFGAAAPAFDAWALDWQSRLAAQGHAPAVVRERQRLANPRYVLRNHLAQQVITAAQDGDTRPLHRLMAVLARPFDDQPGADDLAAPPTAGAAVVEVSCSA